MSRIIKGGKVGTIHGYEGTLTFSCLDWVRRLDLPGISFQATMDALNPAGEWLRLAEHYRQMKDDELLLIARASAELTEAAQDVLTAEMRHRGLKLEPEVAAEPIPKWLSQPPSDSSSEEDEDPYADDRKLIELRTVWSQRDAFQVQILLDRAGIPFFLGPEKATEVDKVTSDFTKGVSVQIMRVGWYWAEQAMKDYDPADEPPTPPEEKEWQEIPVRCPKCQSTGIVFEDLTGNPSRSDSQFQWACDECGHRWKDDGIAAQ